MGLRAVLDRCEKSRPPSGFDHRTVQPVGSRYTDYATRPLQMHVNTLKYVYAVDVFNFKSNQLSEGLTEYLESVTQNFCSQNAN